MGENAFGGSHLDMLLATRVVALNLNDHTTDLLKVRTKFTGEYTTGLLGRIDDAGNNFLGKISRTALFEATDNVYKVMAPAKEDAAQIKIQIDIDYKKDPAKRKLILDDLGFTSNFSKIHSQVGLIGLLLPFKRNIVKYKAEMVLNGTPAEMLDRMSEYADVVIAANTIQEKLKGTGKEATAEVIAQLNAVYEEAIAVCKIAAAFYRKNPAKKALFTYTKILANLGYTHPAENTNAAKA